MRNLTDNEICQLEKQACRCNDWSKILVNEKFDTQHVTGTTFSGNITLGTFEKEIENKSGMKFHTGIFNSRIHNCHVGDNTYIATSAIANYNIGKNCRIENVSQLTVEGETAFGNGTVVHVLNESGGRDVKIYDHLSAQTAYILTFYRHRGKTIGALESLIDRYTEKQTACTGLIDDNCTICNCKTLKNIRTGKFATLENVEKLNNGTICSDEINPTLVGCGVIANNFIIGKGSKVYDYALIDNCFVGESCEIGKQYSAVDSLFFCNCQLFHGEACAIFAGPYTTSHHKSTLLIGCMFSFYNAGSGTNQSNHMYKLGPIHQGILERGSKTGSDSYMMLEVRTGVFSLVLGHHEKHFDTSDLPFSYIVNDENKSTLVPAINMLTVGTQRDAKKWAKRDKRKGSDFSDYIIFDLLNPYIVQQITKGIKVLSELKEKQSPIHTYNNVRIKDVFLSKGIEIYRSAIIRYLGEQLTKHINADGLLDTSKLLNTSNAIEPWIDMAGLVAPKRLIENELDNIENGKYTSIDDINNFFHNIYQDYENLQWDYTLALLNSCLPTNAAADKNYIIDILTQYKACVESCKQSIVSDANKEFDPQSKVGFGIDDKNCKDDDFLAVQGSAENNSIIKNIIDEHNERIKSADEAISKL
ncbi:MAG: DUF4954 family protein [Bacteroidales bacterium]|nr:DUF4954 family protein [Bacteroidales bacterium]